MNNKEQIKARVSSLHDSLLEAYTDLTHDEQAIEAYKVVLARYTSTTALATTLALCTMLGIDTDNIRLLDLTTEQYDKLEASGQLGAYIEGRGTLDD